MQLGSLLDRAKGTWPKTAAESVVALLPRRSDYAGLSRHWRSDVVAGVTVAIVALPLALAFGITSGLGAAAGLTTAIVAGLVAGVFGGSNLQVSGPTGAMTVVLVPLVARDGASAIALVGALAGILIVVAALLRMGRYLAYVPWPVIEGFTLGIAVIIFLQQVPYALGVSKPEGDNTAVVAVKAVGEAVDAGSFAAFGLVVLVVVVMVAAPKLHRAIPASLLAVVVATVVTAIAGLDVATIGELPASLALPGLPSVAFGDLSRYIGPALAVAALAAIESLLSAKVADGMADGPRHDPNRELFGQGLANIASPLFGGMPATGAIARTAVNVRAGARTRLAAMVHSVVLVLVVLLGAGLVAEIPLAALAGVLMVTAVRMVEPRNIRAVLRATRSDAVVLVLTALATVAFDLVVAVEIGLAVAAILVLRSVARSAAAVPETIVSEVDVDEEERLLSEHIVTYRLDGVFFFGVAHRFLTELAAVTDVKVVIIRFPDLQVLDATGAQALGEIVDDLERRNITVLLKGPRPAHERALRAVGVIARLSSERHLFTNLDDAVEHARSHVQRSA